MQSERTVNLKYKIKQNTFKAWKQSVGQGWDCLELASLLLAPTACRHREQCSLKAFFVVVLHIRGEFQFWSLTFKRLKPRYSYCENVAPLSSKCHIYGKFTVPRGRDTAWHSQSHYWGKEKPIQTPGRETCLI